MASKDIETAVAQMQQLLEREYPRLEWRVLVGPSPSQGEAQDPWVFVHVRTRDFRYRCRVGRPSTPITAASTIRLLVAELAAEAEQQLAEQAAGTP